MFNFSNPAFQDWYIYEFIGEAVNSSLVDSIFFVRATPPTQDPRPTTSSGSSGPLILAPSEASRLSAQDAGVNVSVAPTLDAERYIRDSQAVFDRAVEFILGKGKWPVSWTGFGNDVEITNATCDATMAAWMVTAASG